MKGMSKARAEVNRKEKRRLIDRYPHTHTYEGRIDPKKFADTFGSIAFAVVPVHTAQTWMFETELDLELFQKWSETQ